MDAEKRCAVTGPPYALGPKPLTQGAHRGLAPGNPGKVETREVRGPEIAKNQEGLGGRESPWTGPCFAPGPSAHVNKRIGCPLSLLPARLSKSGTCLTVMGTDACGVGSGVSFRKVLGLPPSPAHRGEPGAGIRNSWHAC